MIPAAKSITYWVIWKGSNRPSGTHWFSGAPILTTKDTRAMATVKATMAAVPGKVRFAFEEGLFTSQ